MQLILSFTRILLLPVFAVLCQPVFSQSVRMLTTKEGLPQSFVSGLVQDDSSFVWLGTRNGISVYDGIRFKIFQHDQKDTSSLSSNLIIWLRKDNRNRIWIEHESGDIDVINPVTEKIKHLLKGNLPDRSGVNFVRRGWIVDSDGMFWGIDRSNGLNTYQASNKKIERYNHSNAGFLNDTIRAISELRNNQIWILSQEEIGCFDKIKKHFSRWKIPYQQNYGNFPESDAIAIDLHERKNGELMWGDRQNLYFFNIADHSFRKVFMPKISYLGVRWIRTGNDGLDYLESFGRVYSYGDLSGLKQIGDSTALFGDVKSFLVDHSGMIWMGTNAGGLIQIDQGSPDFTSFNYKNNFVSDMLLREFGLDMRQMFDWHLVNNVVSPVSYNFRSAYDANKRLFIALKQTVCYYDSHTKVFTRLPKVPVHFESEQVGVGIKGITIRDDGSPIVIGFAGDIFNYNFSEKKWVSLIDEKLIRSKYGSMFLPLDIIIDENKIWVTTADDGLLIIDLKTQETRLLKETPEMGSLPTNHLVGLKTDPGNHNLLWIGSYQGLICLNKTTLKCQVYSTKQGLPDNTIYSILTDKSGNLWLSTNRGICRFNPHSGKVRQFHNQPGVPGDEFNRFHHLELPDGRLCFGGTTGWTIFNPLTVRDDNYNPQLAITDLKINNKVSTDIMGIPGLQMPTNALTRIVLPYDQNTIVMRYAGLEFTQPQDLLYRYKLEGYDKDWVVVDNVHQLSYTKIPPGNYTIKINASNTTGKWSDYIKSIPLTIESPWWATPLAYLCYTIILAGLIWTLIRFRVSQAVMKSEMEMKEKEALQLKEIDDMKSRFFSNITHEFRTPLTLIMGPAEQIKETQSTDPRQKRLADTIISNAKQLLTLINRLLDLSKLEAKAFRLHEQRGILADVLGSVVHSFESDANDKKVQLSFVYQGEHRECWFYADAIERIVYNLISNALKFTPPGGKVEVKLNACDGILNLIVSDTGIGIEREKLPFIFDRFYQAREYSGLAEDEWESGTGIGLSLVKELVNQMNAQVEVESFPESAGSDKSGTIFLLRLPYRVADLVENRVVTMEDRESESLLSTEDNNNKHQLLLVEDSSELAGFISGILSEKYHVLHVINGAAGLETALVNMPDLIISDVMMPVMDGYEMCSRLKEDERTSHIPVILLTAKVTKENQIEGLSRGADDYLTKPFHPTELLLRVHNLMQTQDRMREWLKTELSSPGSENRPIQNEILVQDIFITRLYELLDEHIDDEAFGVEQLVNHLNLSRSSLHRKLKTLTGLSTSEVVRNYRLKKAAAFLREGYGSSETAYKTGFGSPAYFTKCFREVYHLTPGDYVKNLGKTGN
jgi:signal transduction histidine kinase/DNA-binding response OmpR family regulator